VRELHSFSDERLAKRFINVLHSRQMPAHAEQENDSWIIWIERDDDRDRARSLLAEYQANPDAPEFDAAEKTARQLEAEAQKAAKARQRLNVDIRDRWKGVWWKTYPVTTLLTAISVIVVVFCTDWQKAQTAHGFIPRTCNNETSVLRNGLFIQAPVTIQSWMGDDYAAFGEANLSGTLSTGQLWRLITPIFLHFDGLHILFNMMWLRNLGFGVEFVRGPRRYLAIVLLIAILSNVTQLYWSGPAFGGMSGVVFGLIGYVWMKGRTQPQLGLGLLPDQVVWAILWMLLCIGGAFGPIANAAHVSGLIVGMLIGARQAIWKRLKNSVQSQSGGKT
jgi:GlpG protein